MGLNAAALNRFRGKVDDVLVDFFPCSLLVPGSAEPVVGSGPGSRVISEYKDGGESKNFRFPFRVLKTIMTAPVVGGSLVWVISETESIPLEVIEVSVRPHEDRWSFICRNRRV